MFRLWKLVFVELLSSHVDNSNRETEASNQDNVEIPSEYYEKEEKAIMGKITELHQDYGLIDGYIYFSKDNLRTNTIPKVDEAVDVSARRLARHTGWRAQSVLILSDDWDTMNEVRQLTGIITNLGRDGSGTVSSRHRFTHECCKGYEPWRGDKIRMTIVDNGTTQVVKNVEPFSVQTYTGKVVHVGQTFCFIDGDLAFTRQCCTGSYIPCRGDFVSGTMMECDQGQRWSHRALDVHLLNQRESGAAAETSSSAIDGSVLRGAGEGDRTKKIINGDYIFVEGELQFTSVALGESKSHVIFVRNGTKDRLRLRSLRLGDSHGAQFSLSEPKISLEGQHARNPVRAAVAELLLLPGMTFYFSVTFQPRYVGEDKQELWLEFEGVIKKKQLVGVCVPVTPTFISGTDGNVSKGVYRQVRHSIQPTDGSVPVLPGSRPQFNKLISFRVTYI